MCLLNYRNLRKGSKQMQTMMVTIVIVVVTVIISFIITVDIVKSCGVDFPADTQFAIKKLQHGSLTFSLSNFGDEKTICKKFALENSRQDNHSLAFTLMIIVSHNNHQRKSQGMLFFKQCTLVDVIRTRINNSFIRFVFIKILGRINFLTRLQKKGNAQIMIFFGGCLIQLI